MVSGEANVKEEIGESAHQFAELQKEVFFRAREKHMKKRRVGAQQTRLEENVRRIERNVRRVRKKSAK